MTLENPKDTIQVFEETIKKSPLDDKNPPKESKKSKGFRVIDIFVITVLSLWGLSLALIALFFSNEIIPNAPVEFLEFMFFSSVFFFAFAGLIVIWRNGKSKYLNDNF